MKKSDFQTKVIAEVAILSALAFALDVLQGGYSRGIFENGGSIGIAMLPILLVCYRHGFLPGLVSGLIVSFLQFMGGIYAIADTWYNMLLQVLLDYIIAYPLVSVAGLFANKFKNSTDNKQRLNYLVLGTTVGGMLKFLSHYLAGVIFWSSSCPENFPGGPNFFSFVYNGGYCIPNIILSCIFLGLFLDKAPHLYIFNKKESLEMEEAVNE